MRGRNPPHLKRISRSGTYSTVPDHEEIQAFRTDKSRLADEVHVCLIRDDPALVTHVQDLANRLTTIIAIV